MIKIFTKQRKTLETDIDTWIVKWSTYKYGVAIQFPNVKQCYQAFTNKTEAQEYADALNKAMDLLQITSLPKAKVIKQEPGGIN